MPSSRDFVDHVRERMRGGMGVIPPMRAGRASPQGAAPLGRPGGREGVIPPMRAGRASPQGAAPLGRPGGREGVIPPMRAGRASGGSHSSAACTR